MTADQGKPRLRIATYNLQKCVGLDMRRRPDRALSVIGQIKADVVVLQEADKRIPPRPAALPRAMAETEGWSVVQFAKGSASLGWHGNAMLYGPQLAPLTADKIELPGLEPRGAILAEFDTPLGTLRVVGTHLGLLRRYRLLQLKAIMKHLRKRAPMPTVIAGDFNEWASPRALDTATQGIDIIDTPPSFPSPRPIGALDRFALTDDLHALRTGRFLAKPARIASDHLPVWADIERK